MNSKLIPVIDLNNSLKYENIWRNSGVMKNMKSILIFIILVLCNAQIIWGQGVEKTDTTDPDSSGVVSSLLLPTSLPLLLFDDKAKEAKKKSEKKKVKKNLYYGEKTRKGLTKQKIREQTQVQFYNFTTQKRVVDPYIRDIYWIDSKNNVIRSKEFLPEKGYLLHGPYEKVIDDTVVEKGMFYFGTKHGTWMSYDNKNILLDKGHYSEGWPRESRVTYYNRGERQIEKITPVEYDLEEGNFYHFYENGQVAVTGEYRYGEKVGLWTEYWDTKNLKTIRKREIQYQEQPFSKSTRPFIRAEWDKDGSLVFRKD